MNRKFTSPSSFASPIGTPVLSLFIIITCISNILALLIDYDVEHVKRGQGSWYGSLVLCLFTDSELITFMMYSVMIICICNTQFTWFSSIVSNIKPTLIVMEGNHFFTFNLDHLLTTTCVQLSYVQQRILVIGLTALIMTHLFHSLMAELPKHVCSSIWNLSIVLTQKCGCCHKFCPYSSLLIKP